MNMRRILLACTCFVGASYGSADDAGSRFSDIKKMIENVNRGREQLWVKKIDENKAFWEQRQKMIDEKIDGICEVYKGRQGVLGCKNDDERDAIDAEWSVFKGGGTGIWVENAEVAVMEVDTITVIKSEWGNNSGYVEKNSDDGGNCSSENDESNQSVMSLGDEGEGDANEDDIIIEKVSSSLSNSSTKSESHNDDTPPLEEEQEGKILTDVNENPEEESCRENDVQNSLNTVKMLSTSLSDGDVGGPRESKIPQIPCKSDKNASSSSEHDDKSHESNAQQSEHKSNKESSSSLSNSSTKSESYNDDTPPLEEKQEGEILTGMNENPEEESCRENNVQNSLNTARVLSTSSSDGDVSRSRENEIPQIPYKSGKSASSSSSEHDDKSHESNAQQSEHKSNKESSSSSSDSDHEKAPAAEQPQAEQQQPDQQHEEAPAAEQPQAEQQPEQQQPDQQHEEAPAAEQPQAEQQQPDQQHKEGAC